MVVHRVSVFQYTPLAPLQQYSGGVGVRTGRDQWGDRWSAWWCGDRLPVEALGPLQA